MRLSTSSLARGSARRPWLTVGAWAVALVAAAAAIVFVLPGTLTAQYTFFGSPGSQVGRDLLAERMDLPPKANEVILVRSSSLTTDDPAFRAAVLRLQQQVAALGPDVVDGVASAYAGGDTTLVSADGHTAILPVVDGRRPHAGREQRRRGARRRGGGRRPRRVHGHDHRHGEHPERLRRAGRTPTCARARASACRSRSSCCSSCSAP